MNESLNANRQKFFISEIKLNAIPYILGRELPDWLGERARGIWTFKRKEETTGRETGQNTL